MVSHEDIILLIFHVFCMFNGLALYTTGAAGSHGLLLPYSIIRIQSTVLYNKNNNSIAHHHHTNNHPSLLSFNHTLIQ